MELPRPQDGADCLSHPDPTRSVTLLPSLFSGSASIYPRLLDDPEPDWGLRGQGLHHTRSSLCPAHPSLAILSALQDSSWAWLSWEVFSETPSWDETFPAFGFAGELRRMCFLFPTPDQS